MEAECPCIFQANYCDVAVSEDFARDNNVAGNGVIFQL